MEVVVILLVIVMVLLLIIVWRLFNNQSNNQNQQNKEIIAQISLSSAQNQLKLFSDLSDIVNKNSKEYLTQLQDSRAEIDRKFGDIQLKNQEQLHAIKESLQANLRSSLQQVIETTKQELQSVQGLTKSQLQIIAQTNQEKLSQIQSEIEKKLGENLQQNLKSFENVTRNLGEMQSTAVKMIDSTRSIDKLNSIFERTSSKAFGDFGERYLESILEQHLDPQSWQKQVGLVGSSDRIDFVIRVGDKIIGIDCKFPVTKYQDYLNAEGEAKKTSYNYFLAAIKQMGQEISTKYYRTEALDALLLYLPSDGMFAEVVNSIATVEALQKFKVTPCSPATLFPLIMLISEYQFKQKVNENAEEIIKGLSKIKKNVLSFRDEFRKLGDKLRQAQQNYESADRSLDLVHKTVDRLETSTEENPLLE